MQSPQAPVPAPDPLRGSVFSRSLHNAAASRVLHAQPQGGEEKPPEPRWSQPLEEEEEEEETPQSLPGALRDTSPAPSEDKRTPRNRTRAPPSEGPSRGDHGDAAAVTGDGTVPQPGLASLAWAEPGHGRPAVLEPGEEL